MQFDAVLTADHHRFPTDPGPRQKQEIRRRRRAAPPHQRQWPPLLAPKIPSVWQGANPSIGVYPAVDIEVARQAAREAKKLIAKGCNPIDTREKKTAVYVAAVTTFGKVGREFLDLKAPSKAPATRRKLEWQYAPTSPPSSTAPSPL
jgi:Arm DNA-binding domain